MIIYCTGCKKDVDARLTDGSERYPHRKDLYDIPFWHCDACGAWVGCHHKTSTPTKPLGYLATPEILGARKAIHALIDPIWQSGEYQRGSIYAYISKKLGYAYHTGEIKNIDDARKVWVIAADLNDQYKYDNKVTLDA